MKRCFWLCKGEETERNLGFLIETLPANRLCSQSRLPWWLEVWLTSPSDTQNSPHLRFNTYVFSHNPLSGIIKPWDCWEFRSGFLRIHLKNLRAESFSPGRSITGWIDVHRWESCRSFGHKNRKLLRARKTCCNSGSLNRTRQRFLITRRAKNGTNGFFLTPWLNTHVNVHYW